MREISPNVEPTLASTEDAALGRDVRCVAMRSTSGKSCN
jgi:hypothetical protein